MVILLLAGISFLKADDKESKLEALSKNLVSSPNDSNKVHTLIKLADVCKSVSISEADSYANRAFHLSVGLNFRPEVVRSLISIAEIKSYQFDVEGAIHQLVKAKKLAKSDAP